MRLVCPSGGCARVEEFETCHLAKVPSGALVGPGELQGSERGRAIQAAFEAAGKR